MSGTKILHQHLKSKGKTKSQEHFADDEKLTETTETATDGQDETLQEDPNVFLLNNLLMSVQFFKNYDRDVKVIRADWFKETSVESHHIKCFHADSLMKLVGENVKFSPQQGTNKNFETSLHPLRMYISNDNVEAAYDPSNLGCDKPNVWPQYQFKVRTDEDSEKLGCITLIEFRTLETPRKSPAAKNSQNFSFNEALNLNETPQQNSTFLPKKSNFEEKCGRRFTKSEKLIASQNKELSLKMLGKRSSRKYFNTTPKGIISANGFYKFTSPEALIKSQNIQDFRMNFSPTSHKIPLSCFQQDVKNKIHFRKNRLNTCFKAQKLLHSSAFKGYFCDLLIEKLFKPLGLDINSVNQSSVLKEFIIINNKTVQTCITPVILIRDWNNFININKRAGINRTKLNWPSNYMLKITNVLPCYAVPSGDARVTEENLEYERTWKLVFPKAEEFLLLHMMHAHIRCYIFAILIYKSFIETEINSASFGPEHLMHLIFWRVHKNFLAWPEDRPGETLLNYLKVLYKKLQNKTLYDFFVTSRNLFASSQSKDLHKAQALIKKIIENPLPYIMNAIKNLKFESDFYPAFDILQLNSVLTSMNEPKKSKTTIKKEKKPNIMQFQDEERHWKKNAMRRIEHERTAEEQKQNRNLPVESISVTEILNLNWRDSAKFHPLLKIFVSHFIKMATHSIEYKFFSQALFYLHQSQKLLKLMVSNGMNEDNLIQIKEKINKIKNTCLNKFKPNLNQPRIKEKVFQLHQNVSQQNEKNQKAVNNVSSKETFFTDDKSQKITVPDDENIKEEKIITIKL